MDHDPARGRSSRWDLLLICLALGGMGACHPVRPGAAEEGAGEKEMTPGPMGPGGPVEQPPAECRKVDILFVIDNSGSMADNQKSLIASFPGFVSGMRKRLENAPDFHVGIVTTDDYLGNEPGCTSIGSLVTRTGGPASSNRACGPFDGGGRFLRNTDTRLEERFACAAQVGAGGDDDERSARALLAALSPEKSAPGACNAGFLRPDSLLIIVLITDEDDVPDQCESENLCKTYGSGGTPDEWYAEFLRYRKRPENVVFLSLLGRKLDNPCGAVPASRLIRLTNKFGRNAFLGDVCAPSYERYFEEALPVIHRACRVFIPG